MRTLAIDIETYSDIDIKKGVYKYVDSPVFEILLFAYAYDDDPVQLIDLFKEDIPEQVISDLFNKDIVKTAYNAQFETTCISKHLGLLLEVAQWRCTLIDAYNLSFSGSLKNVCEILKISDESTKLSTGTALIRYFCVPCKPTKVNGGRLRNLPEHSEEKWERFKEYCIRDVVAERAVRDKISWFKQCESEHDLWVVDQKINRRGARIDGDFVEACIELDNEERSSNMDSLIEFTGLANPNSSAQFTGWLSFKLGYPVNSVDKEHLDILLNTVDDEKVLEVLKLKKLISKSSTAKYVTLKESTCSDGRLRGTLQFYGASRTGRWAGRIFQPQNLPKNFITDLEDARDLVKSKNREAISLFYEQVPDTLSQLIRTAVIPSEGNRFIVSDFSAIEARVISWLAEEKWRMEVFATHGKIYEASASQMFHIPLEEITKGSPLRARGKVSELACGYGGGTAALIRMGALREGVPEEELQGLIDAWRAKNPNIKKLWRTMENAAKKCIKEKISVNVGKGVCFHFEKGCLIMELPSKRKLCYVSAKVEPHPDFSGDRVIYNGMDQYTRKWSKQTTYGGKLVENCVQAIARDCLAEGIMNLDKVGYDIVMHVHDEVIVESNKDELEEVNALLEAPISWAPGLLLRADGYYCDFYMKD